MIEGRPRESLVLYDNPIEVSYFLNCNSHNKEINSVLLTSNKYIDYR